MTHDDNLARVQALREDGAPWCLGNMRVETAVCDHIEDVLTRHAPDYDETYTEPNGGAVLAPCFDCGDDWPCADYTSALALLDALDGGSDE